MRRFLLTLAILLAFPCASPATWSIVAVDGKTGQMAIASATCVSSRIFQNAMRVAALKEVQAVIVPGKGVAAAQAQIDTSLRVQGIMQRELRRGTPPVRVIEMLKAEDPFFAVRQYGIVDRRGRAAGLSGEKNGSVSLDRQGTVKGTKISFSIQGNILASSAVIEDAVDAFQRTQGTLADRVMAAMEAADRAGGDRRCSCQTLPDPPAPCETKTADVAYLVIAGPKDPEGPGLNDGRYQLEIQVTDENIKESENDNPVKTLRLRYDEWKQTKK